MNTHKHKYGWLQIAQRHPKLLAMFKRTDKPKAAAHAIAANEGRKP